MRKHHFTHKACAFPQPGITRVYTCPAAKIMFAVQPGTPNTVRALTPCCGAYADPALVGATCTVCGLDVLSEFAVTVNLIAGAHQQITGLLAGFTCTVDACADEVLHYALDHFDALAVG